MRDRESNTIAFKVYAPLRGIVKDTACYIIKSGVFPVNKVVSSCAVLRCNFYEAIEFAVKKYREPYSNIMIITSIYSSTLFKGKNSRKPPHANRWRT